MDKEERGSESHHATGGVMWLAAAVAAVVLLRPLLPWESARPFESDSRAQVVTQSIDARLWQDPFGAVRRADLKPETTTSLSPFPCKASKAGSEQVAEQNVLLGVMVAGGPYPADTEARRRARYAVLAALNTMGFVPEDPEHIKVFKYTPVAEGDQGNPGLKPILVPYEWFGPSESNATGGVGSGKRRVVVLWLGEEFRTDPIGQSSQTLSLLKKSCEAAARSLEFVMLGPLFSADLHGMLIGKKLVSTNGSSAMSTAAKRDSNPRPRPAEDRAAVTFYAYGVTADAHILRTSDKNGDADLKWPIDVTDKGVTVRILRSIADDHRVAEALIRELRARGVDPAGAHNRPDKGPDQFSEMPRPGRGNDVVLVSEWDTLDTRALTRTITNFLDGELSDARNDRSRVHAFSYLRGLDGHLPKPEKKGNEDESDKGDLGKPADRKRVGSDRDIERPDGQSQYDYLRRLSTRLHALQRSLQDRGHGIGAIGVLGSDVYDKLLILQALRPQFPGVVFFTTDLDARLLHPRERDWARNLVVASSFGLELHPSLQQGIPPFRDNYQTSLYLSALSALAGLHRVDAQACGSFAGSLSGQPLVCPLAQALFGQAPHPARIYEIGRTRAFDLSENPSGSNETAAECKLPQALGRCNLVHPFRPDLFPRPPAGSLSLAAGLGLAVLLAWALAKGWLYRLLSDLAGEQANSTDHQSRPADRQPRVALIAFARLALAVSVVLAIAALAFADQLWLWMAGYLTQDGQGEPIALFEGISVWPTTLLRLLSIALSIGLLIRGWIRLESNLDMISRRLGLHPSREVLKSRMQPREASEKTAGESLRHRLSAFLRIFSFRLVEVDARTVDPESGLTPNAEAFWTKYILQNRPIARLLRVLMVTLLYWMAARAMIGMVSGRPAAPLRGAVSQLWQYPVVLVSVLSMLLLIFFVVDATVFCFQFVRELQRKYPGPRTAWSFDVESPIGVPPESRWPVPVLEHYAKTLKLDARHVDHWLNMRFVAMRTEAIGKLIYYPYIVISLMFVSRSTVFDRWGAPFVIDILNGISVLIVTICAVLLRSSAERLRRKSIWRLTNDMIALRGGNEAQQRKADQAGLLIEQIRSFREGAFAPYSQQPLLRALLLPLGGLGGTAAIELMSAADL